MFTAIGLAWKLGGFKEVFKLIPRWVWITIAVILVGIAAYVWHGRQMAAFETSIRKDEHAIVDAAWQKRFDDMTNNARIWKQRYQTASGQLAQARSNTHEKTLQSISTRNDALLVRGPGKAAAQAGCRPGDHSGLPTGTGQHQPAIAVANAAGPGVPAGQWATVPWPWLAIRTKEHDELLSEVTQWHGWYPEQAGLLKQQKRLLEEQQQNK